MIFGVEEVIVTYKLFSNFFVVNPDISDRNLITHRFTSTSNLVIVFQIRNIYI